MYIIKNALRCIGRSKGRNLLIGIIALVIAVSACLGLSIRQAAESAKENALSGMNITATISYNRNGAMNNMFGGGGFPGGSGGGKFDRDQFADMMGSASSLTLAEYQKYAALLANAGVLIDGVDYEANVTVRFAIRRTASEAIQKSITEAGFGKDIPRVTGERFDYR